jgi:hypothetical protein
MLLGLLCYCKRTLAYATPNATCMRSNVWPRRQHDAVLNTHTTVNCRALSPCRPPVVPPALLVPLSHPFLYCTVSAPAILYFQGKVSDPSNCSLSQVPFCTVLVTAMHCGPQMHSLLEVSGPCQPIKAFCSFVEARTVSVKFMCRNVRC